MKNILEIDSVILKFRSNIVLDSVYLKCETGKVTGLLGRNGSGKSSLMKIIYGELSTDYKLIHINKSVLHNSYRSSKDIKYLPQTKFIPGGLTVKSLFRDFGLDFSDLVMNFPEFEEYYTFKLNKLSGGERRVIEIFLILVSDTKFCMLDEPFTHVMPIYIERVKQIISREKKNKGIIITDHMYQHIIDVSDDLYVINNRKTYLTKDLRDIQKLGYVK